MLQSKYKSLFSFEALFADSIVTVTLHYDDLAAVITESQITSDVWSWASGDAFPPSFTVLDTAIPDSKTPAHSVL